jgi:hypothetical protein
MKIGWFGISMIRNGTTPTFQTNCINIMMFIMFWWNNVSHSISWNVIVFCMKGNVKFCLMLSPRNSLNNTNMFFFRCGYPCSHVLKVTNKFTIEMIKVQHWKLYAAHYNDDDDTLGICLELKKLQFKYSNYEGMGVPVLAKILDSCQSNLSQ